MAYYQLRREVAFEAARLLYAREETEYHRAKLRAARQVYGGDFSSADLPRNRDIRDQILQFARADRRELLPEQLGRMPDLSPADERPVDRFLAFTLLLEPLERIQQDRDLHPEGDARRTTACRSSSWPGRNCLMTKNFCWPHCCTTWARRSILATMWPPRWRSWRD